MDINKLPPGTSVLTRTAIGKLPARYVGRVVLANRQGVSIALVYLGRKATYYISAVDFARYFDVMAPFFSEEQGAENPKGLKHSAVGLLSFFKDDKDAAG